MAEVKLPNLKANILLRILPVTLTIILFTQITSALIVEVDIKGEINEGTVIKVERAFEIAKEKKASSILIVLNTPGGLVSSTERIVSLILNSDIPVITYVHPQGAFSASAGSFILLSGHVSAMSNGTSVGAATPIAITFGEVNAVEEKTINYIAGYARSIAEKRGRPVDIAEKFVTESLTLTSNEAYKLKVIDILSDSKEDLIEKVNSGNFMLNHKPIKMEGEIVIVEEPLQSRILGVLSNPQIATILFLIGLYGLIFGLTSPGILPETIGVIALILSLIGFGALKIDVVGIILIILGIILLIAELLTPTYGILGSASVVSITLGALLLLDEPLMPKGFYESFTTLIVGVGIGLGALMTFLLIKVLQLKRERKKVGREALINQEGVVVEFDNGEGFAKVRGELWKIVSDDELKKGDRIIVEGVNGLTARVRLKVR